MTSAHDPNLCGVECNHSQDNPIVNGIIQLPEQGPIYIEPEPYIEPSPMYTEPIPMYQEPDPMYSSSSNTMNTISKYSSEYSSDSDSSDSDTEDALNDHIQDINNPHCVTLDQARSKLNVVTGDIDMGGNNLLNVVAKSSANNIAANCFIDSITGNQVGYSQPVVLPPNGQVMKMIAGKAQFGSIPVNPPDSHTNVGTGQGVIKDDPDTTSPIQHRSLKAADASIIVGSTATEITFKVDPTQLAVTHASLPDKGTNTHAVIDTHLGNKNNPHCVVHSQLPDKGTNTHAQLDGHLASLTNPHVVIHAQLPDKGTNTHAVIDTHLADKTNSHCVDVDQAT